MKDAKKDKDSDDAIWDVKQTAEGPGPRAPQPAASAAATTPAR